MLSPPILRLSGRHASSMTLIAIAWALLSPQLWPALFLVWLLWLVIVLLFLAGLSLRRRRLRREEALRQSEMRTGQRNEQQDEKDDDAAVDQGAPPASDAPPASPPTSDAPPASGAPPAVVVGAPADSAAAVTIAPAPVVDDAPAPTVDDAPAPAVDDAPAPAVDDAPAAPVVADLPAADGAVVDVDADPPAAPLVTAPAVAEQPASPPGTLQGVGGLRVLIIAHSADAVAGTAQLLESLGHCTRTAASGREALAAARPFLPELVLVDLALEDPPAAEVAQKLRRDPGLGRPVLAAVSDADSEAGAAQAGDVGCDLHLRQPADAPAIERLVAEVERRRAEP